MTAGDLSLQARFEDRRYLRIVADCEAWLAKHGDSYLGVGWTKSAEHADRRYRAALDVIDQGPADGVTLLDFGCGASHLYGYMLRNEIKHVHYSGLDISNDFLSLSRRKYPHISYYDTDILRDDTSLPSFDYIILNGVFTYKGDLSFDEMLAYCQAVLVRAFGKARRGLAFNVMSKQVEWERDDLFHLPMDVLADFLSRQLSRHFAIRHDYGLYEYMVHVRRDHVRES